MLATVGFDRLDMFQTDRDQYGKRKYLHPKVSVPDLARIRIIVSAVKAGKCYELGELRVVSRPPPPKEAPN